MPETFQPSRHGFAFANDWPSQPAFTRPTPFGTIALGDASAGLCGGMVFAAVDYWRAGVTPPGERPAAGAQLYRFIVDRLVDSWHLPTGIVQYFQWMNLPDGDATFTMLRRRVLIERGLAWRTIKVQWPSVARDLDRGVPVPLGVVTVRSSDPHDLAQNHQVLAYDYTRSGTAVTVAVYDPNRADQDDIIIRFDIATPTEPTTFAHNLGIAHPVRGFFRAAYSPSDLPQR
jgi:hypothetical protein